MIPELNEYGYLPPGIHFASLDELAERFGWQSEVRQAEMESLRWLVPLAKRAGIKRLIVNGSFVTDATEPNDVDCVLLVGDDYPLDHEADAEMHAGFPFLEMKLVEADGFDAFVDEVFGTDRHDKPKGMIEVML